MDRRASTPEADLAAARRGDGDAFARLVSGHRRELHAHCYRMLGSVQDAEDALQETLLAAWRGVAGFEGRSSLRTWLFRIATNVCLRQVARRPRRMRAPDHRSPLRDPGDLGQPVGGPVWLEPWLEDEPVAVPAGAGEADPEQRYLQRESVELAFMAAWQSADVAALLALLAEDARFTMPPLPAWFHGREDIGRFLTERMFATPWRLVPLRRTGPPAFACYQGGPDGRFRLGAVSVLLVRDGRVAEIAGFLDPDLHGHLGLPTELPAD